MFGINILTWGKCLFAKVDLKKEKQLWDLKHELDSAFQNSSLPDQPNPKPFEKYLIKWRFRKFKKDGLIE